MKKSTKIATISSAISAISVSLGLLRDAKSKYEEKFLYTATVDQDSFVYPSLMEWLNVETNTKQIKFYSTKDEVIPYYDGTDDSRVVVNGHVLKVRISRPEAPEAILESTPRIGKESCVFTCRTAAGIDAVQKKLAELTEQQKLRKRNVQVHGLTSYNDWMRRDLAFRDIGSVFLPRGVKEDLLADLENFFAQEDHFKKIGAPWHRGYLFYGPPGNGKSSLCAAIAHRYKMDLFNLPLSSVKDDSSLTESVSCIPAKSMLLIEDIDIFSNTMGRQQGDTGPTLAGLLNALDGVATPHGLLTFITTNRIDTLDPALIRPGRIDKRLELQAPDNYQIGSMFNYIFDEPLRVNPRKFGSMAELTNVFKTTANDPEAARLEIKSGL